MARPSDRKLRAENEELRLRLEEAEQALEAIRTGQVESLVVEGPGGPRIFSLEGAAQSYRVLVEAMNEGAVTLGEDGTVLYCNARLAAMVGQPLQKVMGSSLRRLIPDPARAAFDELLERARGAGVRQEVPLRAAGGEEIPAYLSVSSIVDAGRRVLCLVATDLREQKRHEAVAAAERRARESEERLRQILRYAAAGTWAWELGSGAVAWSPESYRLFGVEPTERALTIEDWKRVLHPEDVDPILAAAAACIEGRSAEFRGEFRVRHPRLGERRVLGVASLERAPDGTPLRLLGLNIDVTDRRRTEEDLETAQRSLAQELEGMTRLHRLANRFVRADLVTVLQEIVDAAIAITHADMGDIQLLDPVSRRLDLVAWRGHDQRWLDHSRAGGEGAGSACGAALREGARVVVEDVTTSPVFAGTPALEVQLSAGIHAVQSTPLVGGAGELLGVVSTHYRRPTRPGERDLRLLDLLARQAADMIERDRVQEALRVSNEKLKEADRRKDEFLGMLSHELRNPLAPIRNSTYILGHAQPGSEQARRAQAVIERQTQHLTRLVDDLLDVTRIARGKIALRRERVDLRDVVRRTAEDLRSVIEGRGVTLGVALPEASVWADVDQIRVGQAIANLLHNAAKFTRQGEAVSLALESDARRARIRVHDTGAGVEPALLPHLFDAFVQGDRTLSRSDGGLGLGLALVKGIAELHGGAAAASSPGVGRGAEFTISLPVAAPVEERLARPPVRAAPRAPGRRVLVVDDNVDAAESLAELLVCAGHQVAVAFDGAAALDEVRRAPPDVVLCDIGLQDMSGYEVARRIRASGVGRTQLIAVSGYARPEDLRRAAEAGFDGHLAKPCALEEIERLLA